MNGEKAVVYNCYCALSEVEFEEMRDDLEAIDGVELVLDGYDLCSESGQNDLINEINARNIKKLLLICSAASMPEQTFNRVQNETGVRPIPIIADEKGTLIEKVKDAIQNPPEAATIEDVVPAALVIGGGIAGIQAALDIADAGFKVYLVEREPSVGGHMSQLDKTFPTLDCSACILTPKMVDVGRHPNIDLMTYSEVIKTEGSAGHFKVRVRKKPRYVDINKCTGCGLCADACRLKGKIPNSFDVDMGKRGAIYVPFPQAVPLKYTIDASRCLFLSKGKCGKAPSCLEACERDAIDFEQKEEIVELDVGAIVVATGYDQFDATLKPEYGYGDYDNVISGLEFERLCSASGPTAGNVVINGKTPTSVVFIQCVGSRDKNQNPYCSRVCCMYAAKQAHLVHEKIPGASIMICYMDVRAFGKGYEEFYERVQRDNVLYVRGNPSEVYRKGDMLIVRGEDTLTGEAYEKEADLVVLATGITPRADADRMAEILGIERDKEGFFSVADPQHSIESLREGIFLAGCCQSPKDIPDTVAHASGAAAKAAILLSRSSKYKEEVVA